MAPLRVAAMCIALLLPASHGWSEGEKPAAGNLLTFDEFAAYVTDGNYEIYVQYHDELSFVRALDTDYLPGSDAFGLDTSRVTVMAAPSFEITHKFVKMRRRPHDGLPESVDSMECSKASFDLSVRCAYPPSARTLEDDYEIFLSDEFSPLIQANDAPIPAFDAFMEEDLARIGKPYLPENAEEAGDLRTLQEFDLTCHWRHTEWVDFDCEAVSTTSDDRFITEYFRPEGPSIS